MTSAVPPEGSESQVFDVFLSHNSKDKPAVERLARKLRQQGLAPWLDKWQLTPGGNWQDELAAGLHACAACAVFVGPHGLGDWVRMELDLATDRVAKDRAFRLFLVLLPGLPEPFDAAGLPPFLRMRTWVDMRAGLEDAAAFTQLVCAIKGIPVPGEEHAPAPGVCPYRGLQPFDEAHAEFYFGREGDIQRLVERLKEARFLAVVGPSGSGKSSLVRAGLLPALKRGALPGSQDWPVRVFTPGAQPLTALATQLLQLDGRGSMHQTLDRLAEDARTLHLAAALALADRPPDARTLLVVDQFEEVFTLCRGEQERARFLANLLYAASIPDGRCCVVLTLRADFYPRCAAYPEYAPQFAARQYLVAPLEPEGLRRVIEEPAWQVGLELEAGLTETILGDVASQPGALPLLEHALLELWARRRGTLLTLEGYRQSGGVQGAIARRAEAIYEGFSAEERAIARNLLLRLTQPGEGTADTRRQAAMDELVTGAAAAETVERVVAVLVEARLLTTSTAPQVARRWVNVSHEALIRGWPRLQEWISEDREGLRIHRQLTEAAQEWERQRDADLLYRGARLAAAREWRGRNPGSLNSLEEGFLEASVALQERARRAAQRRVRRAIGGLVAALLVISAVAAYAFDQQHAALQARTVALRAQSSALQAKATAVHDRGLALRAADARATEVVKEKRAQAAAEAARNEAQQQARIALSRQLAAQSLSSGGTSDLAMLLGVQAVHVADTVEAKSSLLDILAQTPMLAYLRSRQATISGLAFSPSGKTLAAAGGTTVQLWDVARDRPLGASIAGHTGNVLSVAFSADGTMLAMGFGDGTIRLWDVAHGHPVGSPLTGHTGSVWSVAFSPDGRLLASGSADKSVRLWDVAHGRPLGAPLAGHTGGVRSVAFSPDGRMLASGAGDGTIRLWDVARHHALGSPFKAQGVSGVLPGIPNPPGSVWSVAFSSDGKMLASGESYGNIQLWDVAGHRSLGAPLTGRIGLVLSVALSPDGKTLAAGGGNGRIELWDVARRQMVGSAFEVPAPFVDGLTFSPDGTTLASGDSEGTIELWDVAHGTHLSRSLPRQTATPWRLAFSPGGKMLASADQDGTIQLWDVTQRKPAGPPLKGHTAWVEAVAFSPDGRILASGSVDTTVRLWDVAHGRPLGAPLRGHTQKVMSVAFSPDGKMLASVSTDGSIRLWDVAGHRPLGSPLNGGIGRLISMAFSPDGKVLAVGGATGAIRLWDVAKRQPIGLPLRGHGDSVTKLAFSPDARVLASASLDGTIRLWDVGRQRPSGSPLKGNSGAFSVAFSPDGKTLAATWQDGLISLWDLVRGRSRGSLLTGALPLAIFQQAQSVGADYAPISTDVAFSPDGQTLASAGTDGTIVLWDMSGKQAPGILPVGVQVAGPSSAVFSPDGITLAVGDGLAGVLLWDPTRPQPRAVLRSGSVALTPRVAFSPNGRILAVNGDDHAIWLWDVASGRLLGAPLKGHTGAIEALAFSPDGSMLASGSDDRTVRLWDVARRRPLGSPLTGHTESVSSVAFSPDGTMLASGSEDGTIRLWAVTRHQPTATRLTAALAAPVTGLAFSPDGKILAAALSSGKIELWDVAHRRSLGRPLTGHSGSVNSVTFSPDGRTLATGGQDTTIRLWDVASRQPLGQALSGDTAPMQSVAFSPDGRTLVSTGGADGTIRLWDVSPASWEQRACRIAGRNLTRDEWSTYIGSSLPYERTCPDLPVGT